MSTKAILSPTSKRKELLAQTPTDPALTEHIRRMEAAGLCQEELKQDGFIMMRVTSSIADILDPMNRTRWFRARVNGSLGDDTYAITLFGREGIELTGEADLKPGEAWEASPPLVTKKRSHFLHERASSTTHKMNETTNHPIPGFQENSLESMKDRIKTLDPDQVLAMAKRHYPEIRKNPGVVLIIGDLSDEASHMSSEQEQDPFKKKNNLDRTPVKGPDGTNKDDDVNLDKNPPQVKPNLRPRAGGKFPGAPSRNLQEAFLAGNPAGESTNNPITTYSGMDQDKENWGTGTSIATSKASTTNNFLFSSTRNIERERQLKEEILLSKQDYLQINPSMLNNGPKLFTQQ